jgi:hypothetical protein
MIMRKISFNANINETAEICTSIVDLNKRQPIAEDDYFKVTFKKLTERTEKLIGKINAGGINSTLKEKDELRDIDVRAIFYEVEAKCNRRPSSEQKSALRINETLDRYGIQITSDSYTIESAQIRAMLSDLKAPELADDLKIIPDLPALIVNLEQSQKVFDNANAKLLEQKQERQTSKPASVLAFECKNIVNAELIGYIGAMEQANPDKYKVFSDMLETLINDANAKVRDRISAQKRKKENEAEA